jgi:hypothetical protein
MTATTRKTSNRLRPQLQRQRGVATILVISSLLVLTLIGFALITIVQFQKMASAASGAAQARSSNMELVTNNLKDKLQDDLLRTYRGIRSDNAVAAGTNIPDAYSYNDMTYPGVAHKWLSALVPSDSDPNTDSDGDGDKNNDFDAWRQISLFGTSPGNEYIDISTGKSYTPATTQDDLLYKATSALTATEKLRMVDTDGDGFVDARYMLLKTPQSDDLVWTYAVRIIDNSGMINLQTASNAYGATEAPNGQTPADICLDYLVFAADGSAATWTTAFTPANYRMTGTPGAANWLAFYNTKGISAVPDTVTNRLNYWINFGGLQNQAFHLYPNASPASVSGTPIGMADEAELRFKAGLNLASRSFLENTIDKSTSSTPGAADSGPLRSYFQESFTTTARSNRADVRRLLTAINGTHAVMVPASLSENATSDYSEYREPMPLWISELNAGVTPPTFTVLAPNSKATTSLTAPQGVPFFKLNPNTNNPAWLGYVFENLLRQNTTLGSRYALTGTTDYPDATNTAYALAANLFRYRTNTTNTVGDPQVYDPTQAQVTSPHGTTYYGLTLQPFMTQVVYGESYANGGDPAKLEDSEIPGTASPDKRYMAIELRNPWPVPIDLSQFAIRYNNVATNLPIAGSTTWLQPGDYVLVLTNDTKWVGTINTAQTPVAKQIQLNTTTILPNATNPGNGTFEIVHISSSVIVDRIAKTDANWPRPAFTSAARPVNYTASGNYFMGASKLERWWNPTSDTTRPTSTIALGNGYAQSYMLENPTGNSNPTPSTTDTSVLSMGSWWREVNSADTSFTGQVGTFVNSELGNTNPADPTTAKDKTGNPPTSAGFAWPRFQIALPFTYSATAGSSTIGAQLFTVGEVLNIITVAHSSNAGVYTTFGENLFKRYNDIVPDATTPGLGSQPPILNYGQFNNGNFYNGSSYAIPTNRATYPLVPVALTIPAALDIVTSNTSQPFIAGRLNVSTASTEALEALPYLYKTMPSGLGLPTPLYLGSRGIVAFRDNANLSTISGSSPNIAGPNYTNRSTATGLTSLRADPGFCLPSELLMVRSTNAADAPYLINAPAVDSASTGVGAMDGSLDQVIDDTEEDASLFAKLSNVVSTRSDVFTAYVVMKGQKFNKTTALYENVANIRYVATILRGTVLASGINGTIGDDIPTANLYPLTFPDTSLPTGYSAGMLAGRDVLLRKLSGSGAASPVLTVAAKISSAASSGGTVTAYISIAPGAHDSAVTGGTFPNANWEFQIIDSPKVLSFTQARQ